MLTADWLNDDQNKKLIEIIKAIINREEKSTENRALTTLLTRAPKNSEGSVGEVLLTHIGNEQALRAKFKDNKWSKIELPLATSSPILLTGSTFAFDFTTNNTWTGTNSFDNAVTINDSGADVDFRVEGLTDANLLFLDAGNDRVGIGINTGFDPRTGLTIAGDLDIIHTATEADDHVQELHVDAAAFGDVKTIDIDYITGAIDTGQDEGVILINIDEIQADGGEIFGLEVLATEGAENSTVMVHGLKTGVGIGPVHQDVGTFDDATMLATNNTINTNVPDMIDGVIGDTTDIFLLVGHFIILGDDAPFQELEIILATGASGGGIKPKFEYSRAGAGLWTEFTPVDGTNGFRNTGIIAWDASDVAAPVHGINTDTGNYDIRIERERNSLPTTPVLGYAKVAATTEYVWDKNGALTIEQITTAGGPNVFNEDGDDADFRVEGDANINCFTLDAGNDNVTINAVAVSTNYDLMLAGDGVLGLKEGATPTADTNYGKVYCKNDNKLYFQDGAGTEHEIAFV